MALLEVDDATSIGCSLDDVSTKGIVNAVVAVAAVFDDDGNTAAVVAATQNRDS